MDKSLSKDMTGQGASFRPGQARACPLPHPTRGSRAPHYSLWDPLPFLTPVTLASSGGAGQGHTRMDGLVAGEVALVAEGGLAAVTLVGFVTVGLQRVPLE